MTNADIFVKLMEEMIDLKIQQQAGVTLSVKPELKQLLEAKRHTDQQRLEELRAELVRLING